jgi:hypothetical protein
MTIIHTTIPKRKPRKPNATQRQMQADWEALLKKYPVKSVSSAKTTYKPEKSFIRETPNYPSLDTGLGSATKPIDTPKYTGNSIIGIGTLHKSNAVPIFSQDAAIDISKMRR